MHVRVLALFCALFFVPIAFLSPAHAATIDIGAALGDTVRDIVSTVVTGALTAIIGWLAWVAKSRFNIEIEAGHREALRAFLERQANSLIAAGAVKLQGVKIEVNNEALASAANMALANVPQALAFFGLSTARVAQMIVDLIPKQPAAAEALAIAIDVKNPETASK